MAIDGNWKLVMQSPMGARDVQADFKADGSTLSGSFNGGQGSTPVAGTINGNDVAFNATVPSPVGQMELKFTGTLDGDSLSGSVAFGSFGNGSFTGARA